MGLGKTVQVTFFSVPVSRHEKLYLYFNYDLWTTLPVGIFGCIIQYEGICWRLMYLRSPGSLWPEWPIIFPMQVMALIAYLMEFKGNYGPHLIIVPNAVLVNWKVSLLSDPQIGLHLSLIDMPNWGALAEWVAYLASICVLHLLCWEQGSTIKIVFSSKIYAFACLLKCLGSIQGPKFLFHICYIGGLRLEV